MLKRDFIMVQIEELGKIIAQLISARQLNNNASRSTEALSQVYSSLDIEPDYMLEATPEAILARLDEGGRSGLLRLEVAAQALMEESFLNPVKKEQLLRKAKQLLQYIQMNDDTFSIERIEKISEIDALLS